MTYIANRLQATEEQTLALALALAPEELRVVDISFYDKDYYVGSKLIASVTHDDNDFVTQRWVVMVNGTAVHRAATPMLCHRYICIHHKDGSLPIQEQETPAATTGNEIMAQIADECEKHGLELLDDGVYRGDENLGEAGCTDDNWWIIRAGESQEKVPCDSAMDAVYWLSMVDATGSMDYEQLLDLPFDILTAHDWQRLLEYEQYSDLVAA